MITTPEDVVLGWGPGFPGGLLVARDCVGQPHELNRGDR